MTHMTTILRFFRRLITRIAVAIESRLPLGYQDDTGFHDGANTTASEEN